MFFCFFLQRTPTKLRNEGTPTVPSIHSILKVRNTSQRIPNEAKEGKAKKSVRKSQKKDSVHLQFQTLRLYFEIILM